jgi:hypothetical protein
MGIGSLIAELLQTSQGDVDFWKIHQSFSLEN